MTKEADRKVRSLLKEADLNLVTDQESGILFRTIIEKNADGIVIIDEEGKIVFANPAAGELFGAPARGLLGKPFGYPVCTHEAEEIDVHRAEGRNVTVEMRAVEARLDGKNVCVASLRDITDRKLMEVRLLDTKKDLEMTVQKLKKTHESLLEQQKIRLEDERLKVVLQMAGATAHELNQPLTVLLGNLEMIQLHCMPPKEISDYLSEVDFAAKRIAGIVSKVRSLPHYETKPYTDELTIINFDQDVRVLSIEDDDLDYEAISACFKGSDRIGLARAKTLAEGIAVIEQSTFDVILLDYMLPDGNGVDFIRLMKEREKEIPVIMITGQGSETLASSSILEGAFDYFPKNMINEKSLSRSIYNTLEKARLKRDIMLAQRKLAEMATQDALTGLYNRRYFMDILQKEIGRAERSNLELSLYIFDIDHFKLVNDAHGHQAGDAILAGIGRMLKENTRLIDTPCRYGGEEFAVILPNTQLREAQVACERFRQAVFQSPFDHNSHSIRVTLSAGLASYRPASGKTAAELLEAADKALYLAKSEGRNRVKTELAEHRP